MYSDTLKEQWRNLYSDFAQEYDRLTLKGDAPACFRQWYETRLHRWQSVAYPEGIILEQTGDAALSRELTDAMRNFAFSPVKPQPVRPMWLSAALGLIAASFSSALLLLFHWNPIRIVISGIVVFIVTALGVARSVTSAREAEAKRVRDAYVAQLRDYLGTLTAVCDKYETAPADQSAAPCSDDTPQPPQEPDDRNEGDV